MLTIRGTVVYYVHADHLNAPRRVTRPADNKPVWMWESEPFGNALPDQNPAGIGVFVYNLRMPGQVYDQETGQFYNYFRDYDPATGRYGQSDPIGLEGGINTYAYGLNDPLRNTDPRGLDNPGQGPYGPRWSKKEPHLIPPGPWEFKTCKCPDDPPVFDEECLLKELALLKPAGYIASEGFGRGLGWAGSQVGGGAGSVLGAASNVLRSPITTVLLAPFAAEYIRKTCDKRPPCPANDCGQCNAR